MNPNNFLYSYEPRAVQTPNQNLASNHKIISKYLADEMAKPEGRKAGYSEADMDFALQARLQGKNNIVFKNALSVQPSMPEMLGNKVVLTPTFNTLDDKEHLKNYVRDILQQNPKPARIVIPVGLIEGGGHMTSIVIDPAKEGRPAQIFLFDPFGGAETYIKPLTDIIDMLKTDNQELSNASIVAQKVGVQSDVFNCGPWSAWFMREIAASSIPIEQFNQALLEHKTKYSSPNSLNNFIQQEFKANTSAIANASSPKQVPIPDADVISTAPIVTPPLVTTPDPKVVKLSVEQIEKITTGFRDVGFSTFNNNPLSFTKGDEASAKTVTVIPGIAIKGTPGIYAVAEYQVMIQVALMSNLNKPLLLSNDNPVELGKMQDAANNLKLNADIDFKLKQPSAKIPGSEQQQANKAPVENSQNKQSNSQNPPEQLLSELAKAMHELDLAKQASTKAKQVLREAENLHDEALLKTLELKDEIVTIQQNSMAQHEIISSNGPEIKKIEAELTRVESVIDSQQKVINATTKALEIAETNNRKSAMNVTFAKLQVTRSQDKISKLEKKGTDKNISKIQDEKENLATLQVALATTEQDLHEKNGNVQHQQTLKSTAESEKTKAEKKFDELTQRKIVIEQDVIKATQIKGTVDVKMSITEKQLSEQLKKNEKTLASINTERKHVKDQQKIEKNAEESRNKIVKQLFEVTQQALKVGSKNSSETIRNILDHKNELFVVKYEPMGSKIQVREDIGLEKMQRDFLAATLGAAMDAQLKTSSQRQEHTIKITAEQVKQLREPPIERLEKKTRFAPGTNSQ